jgi:uncharacterized phage protein (TIGR01671 family)
MLDILNKFRIVAEMTQRQIKFRYYDPQLKKLVYSDEWEIKNVFERLSIFFNHAALYCVDGQIQQFTGLLDKEGKEIYEGDIIHRYFSHDNQYTYLVDYNQEDCAYVLKKGNEESFMLYVPVKTFKVVGNIFENPELLEKCKN